MSTNLSLWEPVQELSDLRSRVDQMFREFTTEGTITLHAPPVDIVRDEDNLILHCNLPGTNVNDIQIQMEDNRITISGSHSESNVLEEGDFLRRERSSGSFERTLILPDEVNADEAEAHFTDGVLSVTMPLTEEKETKKITITPESSS
jgi:HSP20 family protein